MSCSEWDGPTLMEVYWQLINEDKVQDMHLDCYMNEQEALRYVGVAEELSPERVAVILARVKLGII
jgi:hypothetical protein